MPLLLLSAYGNVMNADQVFQRI